MYMELKFVFKSSLKVFEFDEKMLKLKLHV